jgi:hypothetical protein
LNEKLTPNNLQSSTKEIREKDSEQGAIILYNMIGIFMARQASEEIPEIEEIEVVTCAVHNMHLEASTHGMGVYWPIGVPGI